MWRSLEHAPKHVKDAAFQQCPGRNEWPSHHHSSIPAALTVLHMHSWMQPRHRWPKRTVHRDRIPGLSPSHATLSRSLSLEPTLQHWESLSRLLVSTAETLVGFRSRQSSAALPDHSPPFAAVRINMGCEQRGQRHQGTYLDSMLFFF